MNPFRGTARQVSSAARNSLLVGLHARPRGSIMIIAIAVTVVLTALVLVFAQEMRVEAQASANRAAALQSSAILRGALAYANNHLINNQDPVSLDSEMQSEAAPLGDGYFWFIRPNGDDETQYEFGLTDESSKLNLNTATYDMLMRLPNMTTELASSIVDWRDDDDNISQNGGAENEYYLQLPDPYYCKNAPFETLEELKLVNGATPELLYGIDANRNGVVDPGEEQLNIGDTLGGNNASGLSRGSTSGGGSTGLGGSGGGSSGGGLSGLNGNARCGIMKYLTVYSLEANTNDDGTARINVNTASQDQMAQMLSRYVNGSALNDILANMRTNRPFLSIFDFYYKTGMQLDAFKKIAGSITTDAGEIIQGRVNINTAPKEVLRCLPGLDDGDADALIARRKSSGTDLTNIAWVLDALPQAKTAELGAYITSKTKRISADIVALTGDGRGFKRARAVFDMRGASPKLLYYKDMTHLGFPLDPSILEELRGGQNTLQSGQPAGLMPGGGASMGGAR